VDPDSKRLRVAVTDGAGRRVRDGGLSAWLMSVAPGRATGEVAVALVSDARIRELNRRYRRMDKTTDVLSFSQRSWSSTPTRSRPSTSLRTTLSLSKGRAASSRRARAASAFANGEQRAANSGLGDIVIATGVARRQAKDAGHSLQAELRVLALHGLLHLLGYDHHSRDDRGRMARVEARLRRKGGLRAGLIERARG
jgi:probable rRNA maturation factor